jgi:anti-anti-sigma factor
LPSAFVLQNQHPAFQNETNPGGPSSIFVENVVSLQISVRESGDVAVVDLRGRSTLNDGESELLSRRLQKLIASGMRKLLLNLQELTHADSSGIGVIVGTYVSLRRQGGDLKLLCPTDRVRRVLTVFRLQNIIPSFEDEAQALASFERLGYFAES